MTCPAARRRVPIGNRPFWAPGVPRLLRLASPCADAFTCRSAQADRW